MPPDDGVENLELERIDEAPAPPMAQRQSVRPRLRSIASWVVLVLACILAVTSVLVVFVRNQALDTDAYVATVQPLASDPAVQLAVADAVSARLVDSINLKQQVASVLPPAAGFLATPLSVGLKAVVHQTTLTFVQSQAFRSLWTTINRTAHQQLVALLTGSGSGPLSTARGEVKLDLAKVVDRVQQQLDANGITVFDGLGPSGAPQFVLFKSTPLERLQGLIRTLDRLALLLPIITIGLFVGAVWLQADRRRGFVRAAIGLSIAMAGLLAAFAIGRHQYLGAMSGVTPHRAAAATYDIIASVPLAAARTILAAAVLAALIGAGLGNQPIRSRVEALWPTRWRAGEFHRLWSVSARPVELALFGIGMFVMVIWNDLVVGLPILVLACLLALAPVRGGDPGLKVATPAADDGHGLPEVPIVPKVATVPTEGESPP
ncbi:MAG TPA: hypothetical protein VHU85_13600 [Acidimicrobiales bacterium]|nr:hypothetical protein [Acidimicrobiales bacterium]